MRLLPTEHASKSEARAYYKEKRASLTADERAQRDSALCENLLTGLRDIRTILLFFPIKGEPDILPVAKRLLEDGMCVAFPVSVKETTELQFYRVKDLSQLTSGAYGIPEPSGSTERLTCFDGSACVIPALAYDTRGYRIGYGKGYYDRFLCGNKTKRIGVCYSDLIVDRLPTDKNDIPVDTIVTDKEVIIPEAI